VFRLLPIVRVFRKRITVEVEMLQNLGEVRSNWQRKEVEALFALPFNDLLFYAQSVHRQNFNVNEVQVSTLCSIKTGACPEDCAYCPQSARYDTGLEKERLMAVAAVVEEAKAAKEAGATRFCMGAAWRSPRAKDMDSVVDMVKGVKALGMETCMTLGMLDTCLLYTSDAADDLTRVYLGRCRIFKKN